MKVEKTVKRIPKKTEDVESNISNYSRVFEPQSLQDQAVSQRAASWLPRQPLVMGLRVSVLQHYFCSHLFDCKHHDETLSTVAAKPNIPRKLAFLKFDQLEGPLIKKQVVQLKRQNARHLIDDWYVYNKCLNLVYLFSTGESHTYLAFDAVLNIARAWKLSKVLCKP